MKRPAVPWHCLVHVMLRVRRDVPSLRSRRFIREVRDNLCAACERRPHILVSVFARGLLLRLVTRLYFPDRPENAGDFVLNLVAPERRGTLIARKTARADVLEWDVVLQGRDETVFFDC